VAEVANRAKTQISALLGIVPNGKCPHILYFNKNNNILKRTDY